LDTDATRSYGVMNTLYHETRGEMELLNKQLCLKDNIIADLKTRLVRHERLYMTMGDDEPVVIGPSNSLVESLLSEICKLKQKRNDMEVKAARQGEVNPGAREIQRLTAQIREKELELERIRSQPDHEKDWEIQRLRTALEERERTEATRSVLCSSLAEEADQLRGQLGATVKVCQELLARLEREKQGTGGEVEEQSVKEVCTPELSDLNAAKSQIRQLQEENQQLKQRVSYVQDLNSQWQKYDSSREEYIRALGQKLKESSGPGLMPVMGSIRTGMLHQEISRLNTLLEEKIRECSRLDREVEDMRRQGHERIQTLEQQVLIYTEDFKSERADRERAQGRIADLKEQISQDSRDVVPLCRVHIGHRISPRRNKDSSEPLLRTATDRQQQQAAAECPGPSELQCPKCHARFNDTEAAECIKHFDDCARL
uniref:TNFAIP3-interacting protein 2 n=1 Tax=Poecilia latipinna TaxID=48699 RepID=A0A3B3US47_9TELE